jgi:hypothetical protein
MILGVGVGVAVGLDVIVGVRVRVSVGGMAVGDGSAVVCGPLHAASTIIQRINKQRPKNRARFCVPVLKIFRIAITRN